MTSEQRSEVVSHVDTSRKMSQAEGKAGPSDKTMRGMPDLLKEIHEPSVDEQE